MVRACPSELSSTYPRFGGEETLGFSQTVAPLPGKHLEENTERNSWVRAKQMLRRCWLWKLRLIRDDMASKVVVC